MADKKKLFTGLQPSGQLHIGNYFGALKPTVELFKEHEGLIMVADYHSLTSLKNGSELRSNILEIVRAYLAAGIDPSKATIFKQSDVPEHTELAWIFDCLVTVPFLQQAHAYKDKVAKGLEANAGLFTYPMLMAADILLYDTDIVPVGEDQRQHVEYAREAASKFNLAWGETFKEPQEMIEASVATVPGTDGQKMSKSYKNTIPLFKSKATPIASTNVSIRGDIIPSSVMGIVTDSSGERPENVYALHKLFRNEKELEEVYSQNKGNYKALKEMLIDDMQKYFAPMQEKYDSIKDEDVKEVLKKGGEKARGIAGAKMLDVRKKIGVSL